MNDIETLRRMIENKQNMFVEDDEPFLKELSHKMGFSVIRRPDLPPANQQGKQKTRIEISFPRASNFHTQSLPIPTTS